MLCCMAYKLFAFVSCESDAQFLLYTAALVAASTRLHRCEQPPGPDACAGRTAAHAMPRKPSLCRNLALLQRTIRQRRASDAASLLDVKPLVGEKREDREPDSSQE